VSRISEALVVVEIRRAVWHGLDLGREVGLEAVDVDGGLLLEDGAAQRRGERQDDAAEADLMKNYKRIMYKLQVVVLSQLSHLGTKFHA
jgi:hypothetical protein